MTRSTAGAAVSRSRVFLRVALTVGLLALLFGWVLPSMVDYRAVGAAIAGLRGWQVAVLALVGLTWTVIDSLVFTSVVPGLAVRGGYRAWLASNAVAGFAPTPADLVVRVGIYADYGIDRGAIASGVLLAGVITTAVKLAIPTVTLVVLATTRVGGGALIPVAALAVALCVAAVLVTVGVLRSRSLAAQAGRAAQRIHDAIRKRWFPNRSSARLDEEIPALRELVVVTLRRRWPVATIAALVSQAVLFGELLLSLRFVGVTRATVGTGDLLVAYGAGLSATLLPVLRSGVGTAELIYLRVLDVGIAGQVRDAVAAAAFTQRVFTWVIPVVIGLVVLVDWVVRRGRRPVDRTAAGR